MGGGVDDIKSVPALRIDKEGKPNQGAEHADRPSGKTAFVLARAERLHEEHNQPNEQNSNFEGKRRDHALFQKDRFEGGFEKVEKFTGKETHDH